MSTSAVRTYESTCRQVGVEPVSDFVTTLEESLKVAALANRTAPLSDEDVICIAAAIRELSNDSGLKVLSLESNAFSLKGVQALMDAIEDNPGHIRELRLGKNNLSDQSAVVLGQSLGSTSTGVKVLDVSENGLTKLGVLPLAAALESTRCELVELSFHNNRVEGDSMKQLGEALTRNRTLKHLHLSHNTLRDSGVSSLALRLPRMSTLTTLDLTANRIGNDGAASLATALCDPQCVLQRLNLRHNLIDDMAVFEPVIRKNGSLIQLFLGFMNPSPDAALAVLSALVQNRSLLLLDVVGWNLPPQPTLTVLQRIQQENEILAAIISDSCQSVATQLETGNDDREDRGFHPLYVGPDDRDAYLATKSLKRFSRAQSKRASLNTSRQRSRSLNSEQRRRGDDQDGGGSEASSSRRRRRRTGAINSPATSTGYPATAERSTRPAFVEDERSRVVVAPAVAPTSGRGMGGRDDERQRLLRRIDEAADERELKRAMRSVTEELLQKLDDEREERRALEARVERLERERAAGPGIAQQSGYRQQQQQQQQDTFSRTSFTQNQPTYRQQQQETGSRTAFTQNQPTYRQQQQETGSRTSFTQPPSALQTRSPSAPPAVNPESHNSVSRWRGGGGGGAQTPSGYHHRSISRGNYDERAMTPLVRPSEVHDHPPLLAVANEVSGNQRAEETLLQRSASVTNFPPRIEPSPAADRNPPGRKMPPSAFID